MLASEGKCMLENQIETNNFSNFPKSLNPLNTLLAFKNDTTSIKPLHSRRPAITLKPYFDVNVNKVSPRPRRVDLGRRSRDCPILPLGRLRSYAHTRPTYVKSETYDTAVLLSVRTRLTRPPTRLDHRRR
ncbi:hypothetical protein EVAR_12673_1 [Eumeta japonica]|uniref:Uncharacterized protein n=1 Tax=Eumeta variegata TaxID=151549 RepID=A0A4C1Z0T5_EUMVA|nr:hypothetical protein EVAR_12673_1 [Eumeta japonica]